MAKNITVPTGKYEKDGQEKTNWFTLGRLIDKRDGSGQFIALNDVVTNHLKGIFGNDFSGLLNIFDNEKEEEDEDLPL